MTARLHGVPSSTFAISGSVMPYDVAVDIGGTFTDLVAYDHANYVVRYTKSPTTYENFVEGILTAFGKLTLRPVTSISLITARRSSSILSFNAGGRKRPSSPPRVSGMS